MRSRLHAFLDWFYWFLRAMFEFSLLKYGLFYEEQCNWPFFFVWVVSSFSLGIAACLIPSWLLTYSAVGCLIGIAVFGVLLSWVQGVFEIP